jgi:dipeptidase
MDTPEIAYELHFKRDPGIYDRSKPMAWWNFVAVNDLTDQDYAKRIQERQKTKDDLLQQFNRMAAQMEKEYLPLYKKQPEKAASILNNFQNQVLEKAITENNKFLDK